MVNIKTKKGKFTRYGFTYEFEEVTFRLKSLDKVMEIANEWMINKYNNKFVHFEHHPGLYEGWDYIAIMKDTLRDETNLSINCFIGSTGKQWIASLRHEKEVRYSTGC